jgi:hypothetical protein
MENKTILFNLASRSRPQRYYKVIRNIEKLANGSYLIIAKIDQDDPKRAEYLALSGGHTVVISKSQSKVHAINRDIPSDGWDILVNVSDDTLFTVKGFDNVIREYCGADDFCLFPEPFADSQTKKQRKDRLCVMSIIGRDYYKRDGYVYHPSYQRTHCDNEATEVARLRGRYKEVDLPIFVHHHPAAGYRQFRDAQYQLENITWDQDLRNLNKRRAEGFPA